VRDTLNVRVVVGELDADVELVLSESDVVAIMEVAGDGLDNVADWIGNAISDRIDEFKEERRLRRAKTE